MGHEFRVGYANGRGGNSYLYETENHRDVAEWSKTCGIPHHELEVYRHADGDYISLTNFLTAGPKIIKPDNINHPKHYTAYKGIEVIDLTEQMNFNRGNAVKYIARAGLKDPSKEVEDLEKALWYIRREIERIGKKA